jgi:acetyl esterase/lipase
MPITDRVPFPLWRQTPPLAKNDVVPLITPFLPLPKTAKPVAIVIFPGGGYHVRAPHEGRGYAEFLAANGYFAFVVDYRLVSEGYSHPAPLADAAQGIRVVRRLADELGFSPQKIGAMGSSAGGHLAATLANLHATAPRETGDTDAVSARPDFLVLCYSVLTGNLALKGGGSIKNVAGGDGAAAELLALLSPTERVTAENPPAFLWHTFADNGVAPEHSIGYALALEKVGVGAELHLYHAGTHGIGLAGGHLWSQALLHWLALW